jgi:tetratricopeptide (TPR) repeat protein
MRISQVTVALTALFVVVVPELLADAGIFASVSLRYNQGADIDGVPITSLARDVLNEVRVSVQQGTSVHVIFYAKALKQPSLFFSWLGRLTGPSTVQASPASMSSQGCRDATSALDPGRYTFEGPAEVIIKAEKLTFGRNTCTDFDSKVTGPSRGLTALLHSANLSDTTTRTLKTAREAEIAGNLKNAINQYTSLLGARDDSGDWASRRIAALERLQRTGQPADSSTSKRARALVVGISDYRWLSKGLSLPSARNDAYLFYQFLVSKRGGLGGVGRGVDMLLDQEATASAIRLKLRQIADEVASGETVYVFISAHSIPLSHGDAGIVAYDTRTDVQGTALPFSEIAELLSDIQLLGGNVILFADTCHAGLLDNKNPSSRRIVSLAAQITGLVSSSKVQSAAADGRFTSALVSALAKPCGVQPCGKLLLQEIEASVRKTLGPDQTAEVIGNKDNRFSVDLSLKFEIDSDKPPPGRGPLPSPGEAVARARELLDQPRRDDYDWRRRSDAEVVVLERLAQEPVLRYLGGDDFYAKDRNADEQEFLQAAELFDKASRLHPDDTSLAVRGEFCRARALLLKGDSSSVATASQLLDHAIVSEPLASYLYNARGMALLQGMPHGDRNEAHRTLQAAIREFQKAILLDPFWAYPRHNLALAYKAAGNDQRALEEYQQGILFAQFYGLGTGYLHHNLGALYAREQDWPRARDAFEKAAKVFLDESNGFSNREKRAKGEKDAATEAWAAERVAYMTTAQAEAINALGTVYALSGADGAAAREYKRAWSLDKNSVDVHHNWGLLILKRASSPTQFTDALSHFHENEILTARDTSVLLGRKVQSLLDLGEFFLRQAEFDKRHNQDTSGDYQKASKYFGEALGHAPDSAAAKEGLTRATAGVRSR